MKRKGKRPGAGEELPEGGGNPQVELDKLASGLAAKLAFEPLSSANEDLDPAIVQKAKAEAPELLATLRQLRQRMGGLQESTRGITQRFAASDATPAKWGSGNESPAAYVEVKVQMMLGYIIGLVYYLLLKSEGASVRDHPAVLRLAWIRTVLEKLRPVDQRLQYQISKLLQWADARKAGNAAGAQDPTSLKPGELAAGVEDEDGEGNDEAEDGAEALEEDRLYRPPKIAQAEFTGDHFTLRERAERDLERKRERLDRSEFVRSLREEFTDAPAEIHSEVRSARAERAARKMAEQQAYEEDNMVRVRGSKKQLREQRQLLSQRRAAPAGAVSLSDATVDFDHISSALLADNEQRPGRGRKGRRGGSALQEFQDASKRVRESRHVVDSSLGGDLGDFGPAKRKGGGKGRGKGGGKGGGKRQKR